MQMIATFAERIPVLGVCLGHQSLVEVFGGKVVRAGRLMHGKTSLVQSRSARGVRRFARAFRSGTLSLAHRRARTRSRRCSKLSASTPEGEIMGVRHRLWPVEGVQFHPESILTPDGPRLMGNFLEMRPGRRS